MSASLVELCQRARPELACLGQLGGPLVAVVGVVEHVGATRDVDALADPGFALDVLSAAGPDGDASTVGRVLDFLRSRADTGPVGAAVMAAGVKLSDAVELYEAGALALMAEGTQHTYRTWTRRLVADHGECDPASVTAGDLTDLIAKHVLAGRRRGDERRRSGRSAEENAVGAYRHLWAYLLEKGYVRSNVAMRLRKPARVEPNRRGVSVEEAALLRQLARRGRDPLLDEVTVTLPERLGLRRIELCRLRVCDLDLDRDLVEVWGKGDKYRTLPLPPRLADLLARYVEDRRPARVSTVQWRRSAETLLRRPPEAKAPMGVGVGRRRIEDLFDRFHRNAPDLFAHDDVPIQGAVSQQSRSGVGSARPIRKRCAPANHAVPRRPPAGWDHLA